MSDLIKIAIGIQARSTSHRFPNKSLSRLGKDLVLSHVIRSCTSAMGYLNANSGRNNCWVSVCLLIPHHDPIRNHYPEMDIIEGNESDVLSRYVKLCRQENAHYVVRITGDCPLIPDFVITKHIHVAMKNEYDYVSNVDERCRTTPDGWDCEVISRRLLNYVNETAHQEKDREHVTTLIRSNPPSWIKHGTIINFLDLSQLKISVDTKEDLDRIELEHDRLDQKLELARKLYGKSNVHRL